VDERAGQGLIRLPGQGSPGVAQLKGVGGIAVAIGLWELLRALHAVPTEYVPSFPDIVRSVFDNLGGDGLAKAIGQTLEAWAIGMAITVGLGGALGVVLGLSRWADAALRVVVDFLRPVPSVALIPVAVLIFGIELKMQLALIVFACVWPVLFNVRYGVRSVEPLLVDTGRVCGLSGLALVRRVVLPAALPAAFTGVRIASSIALVLAVSSEIVAGAPGIGKVIVDASTAGNDTLAYAGVLVTGICGFLLNAALMGVDRWVLPWSVASRGGAQ
jgi:NitT/TauT family transport system permease protein